MKLTLAMLGILFLVSGFAQAADEPAAKKDGADSPMAPIAKDAMGKKKKPAKKDKKADKTEAKARKETLPDGLKIEDLKVGDGMEAKLGSKITVHYRGTFKDGKEFDSSYKGGSPAEFPLEEGGLIKGWTEGIPGMKVGGKRKLVVPYKLAYGERGTPDGSIPPKSDLNFEVELLKVE